MGKVHHPALNADPARDGRAVAVRPPASLLLLLRVVGACAGAAAVAAALAVVRYGRKVVVAANSESGGWRGFVVREKNAGEQDTGGSQSAGEGGWVGGGLRCY